MGEKRNDQIIKRISKDSISYNGYYIPFEGFRAYTDGFRVFADRIERPGYYAEESDAITKAIKEFRKYSCPVKINKKNLAAFLKTDLCKVSKRPYVIDANGYYIGFNPRYLKDMIDFIGSETVYADIENRDYVRENFQNQKFLINGFFAGNDDKMVLVLPVNLNSHNGILPDQNADGEILNNYIPAKVETIPAEPETMTAETAPAAETKEPETEAPKPETITTAPEPEKIETTTAETTAPVTMTAEKTRTKASAAPETGFTLIRFALPRGVTLSQKRTPGKAPKRAIAPCREPGAAAGRLRQAPPGLSAHGSRAYTADRAYGRMASVTVTGLSPPPVWSITENRRFPEKPTKFEEPQRK